MSSTTVPAIVGSGAAVAVGLGDSVGAGVMVVAVTGADELGWVAEGVGVRRDDGSSSLHAASVASETTPPCNSTRRVARTPPP
jgi:hypothetical protein